MGNPLEEIDRLLAGGDESPGDASYRVTSNELRSFMERVEKIRADKAELAEAEREVFAEAKARGYDTKVMRAILTLRKQDPDAVAEFDAVFEMYKEALGMR